MNLTEEIIVSKTKHSRLQEVDFENLEFGKEVSDHMLVADFSNGEWQQAGIIPYSNLTLSPIALALHYGQTVFEGMKAFQMNNGSVSVFRPDKHYERFNMSLTRMSMPTVSEELFIQGIQKLVELDRAWIPPAKEGSLYIRPFAFASESRFGVKVSEEYKFLIVTGPVRPYYPKPLRLKVERHFVRAVRGGTGNVKCGGNYGGALYPTELAKLQGYDNVIWTDAFDHENIEESGTMNVMFVIDKTVVTPSLTSSILDGITRDSILAIASDLGYEKEERPVTINELKSALDRGILREAFGVGTAAVIAPVSIIGIDDVDYSLPKWSDESFMMKARKKLLNIRSGVEPDIHQWNYVIS